MTSENWASLCEIGFWGWVLSVIGLLAHAFNQPTGMIKKSTVIWGLVSVGFYLFWIYGMVSA